MSTGVVADVRVVLVVPYEGVRHGLAMLLDGMRGMRVVAQSSSAAEGIVLVERHAPDLVILDADPQQATRTIFEIRRANPTSRLLVTVDETTRDEIEEMFGADVQNRTIQAVYPRQLFPAVRELLRRRKEVP